MHSSNYRSSSQLRTGSVLVVGAGNSGAEIALELVRDHPVQLSGRHTGELPFRLTSVAGRRLLLPLLLRFAFRKVLTVRTPIGRKIRPRVVSEGGPLIRVRKHDLDAAGVEWIGRTDGVRDGMPVVEDGRRLEVANVIWCTGFRTGFESWIDLPVHGEHDPVHQGGVVVDYPGLYFLGLHFLRSLASVMIHGVGEDAGHIARHIERRGQQRHRGAGRASSRSTFGPT
jgi:putative flavoprotein involved in K+ transport